MYIYIDIICITDVCETLQGGKIYYSFLNCIGFCFLASTGGVTCLDGELRLFCCTEAEFKLGTTVICVICVICLCLKNIWIQERLSGVRKLKSYNFCWASFRQPPVCHHHDAAHWKSSLTHRIHVWYIC